MELQHHQQVLLSSGSFTGFRPLQKLGSDYLSATVTFKQPLCGNEEGWGPLSPFRFDFTPCFIDVWIATVSVFGLLFGAIALWLLLRKKPSEDKPKNLQFYMKQVSGPS